MTAKGDLSINEGIMISLVQTYARSRPSMPDSEGILEKYRQAQTKVLEAYRVSQSGSFNFLNKKRESWFVADAVSHMW